jgi:hypothetical protein
MNRKVFWGIFAATQLVGMLGVATGSPHGNPLGLVVAMIFLFPGSILGLFILDALAIPIGYGGIITASLLINVVCWYALALALRKIRGKKTN